MRYRFACLLGLCLAAFGCGSGDEDGAAGGGGSGQHDAAPDVGDDATIDGPSADSPNDVNGSDADQPDVPADSHPDAPTEASPDVAGDVTLDTTEDVAEDVAPDALVDASTRPPGQCKSDSDCTGPMATCSMSAPGGICLGCGSDSDCGNPLEFECFASACRRLCADNEDCPHGMECSLTQYCRLISCSTSCPDPYICEGDLCRRPECSTVPPACPTGMSCGQENYCVEDG